jgi:hypothetical protein
MKMRMGESKFGAPVGTYLGRFLGVKVMKDDGKPRLGRDGKPMPPGMEWQWEVTDDPDHDGAYVGQIVGRITSQEPTAGNACGRLLGGIVDRCIKTAEEIDPDEFAGQLYRVTVGPQMDNKEKTQVIQVTRIKTGAHPAPPSGSAPPRPGAAPKPPPPRPAAQQPPPHYWVEAGEAEPVLMSRHEAEHWLEQQKISPATVTACQEGTDAWKTLADYGFKDSIPF